MGRAENDIDGVWAGFDDFGHGIEHDFDALVRRQKPKCENDRLSGKAEFCLGVMRFDERKVGYSVRNDLDLVRRHVMNGSKKFPAFFCHDDDFCRHINDPTHHVALDGCRFGEDRVKRSDNRHFEVRQELDDIAAGLPAENAVFVLKGNNVESALFRNSAA